MGFYELAEKALALEKGSRKVMRLNVGDTNLPTPQCAIDAAVRSMQSAKAAYGPAAGLPEFRKMIAEREGCKPENVVVGAGSKQIIYGLMSMFCGKGDTIAFPAPYWPAYALTAKHLGINISTVKTSLENGWAFDANGIGKAAILIICNPLNPTSTIYSEESVQQAIGKASNQDTIVVVDEAYKGLSFKPMPQIDGAIRIRSFSKEFNMEGWRLGYAIAPEWIAAMLTGFNQITTTCVPPFVQAAGMACLENEKAILAQNRKAWLSRSEAAQKALARAGFRFAKPQAGIYIFATHPAMGDAEAFATELLERESICVAPGTGFGGYSQFIRICVNQPEDALAEAIGRMGRLLNDPKPIKRK